MYIPCIYYEYNLYITCIYNHTKNKSAATMRYHVTSVYTMYIPCIYQTYTCIYNWYRMYLFSGVCGSYRPSAPPTHGLEDKVPDIYDEFCFPRYTSSVGNIHDPYVQAGGCWVPGARTGWVKVQGSGELLLSYNKYILVICITYTMHIPCISNRFKLYIQKISIGYTLYMPSISQVYCVYKHYIYHAYTM